MFRELAEPLMRFDRSLERLPSEFVEKIVFWASWPEVPVTRQALETDLGYINPDGEHVVNALVQLFASKRPLSQDLMPDLQRRQRIFRAARAHGASRNAVRDAYMVEYGALECFVLPQWLAAMKPRFADSSAVQALAAYTEAVDRIQAEASKDGAKDLALAGVDREVFGALLWGQGNCHVRCAQTMQRSEARLENFGGLMALQGASLIFKQEVFPLTYAKFIPDWEAAKRATTSP